MEAAERRSWTEALRCVAARTRCVVLRRCHVSLRVTILALLAGLLFSTIAPIAGVTFFSTSQAIGELEGTHFLVVSTAATREIESLLEPARSLLAESRTQAERDLLPVDEPDRLGDFLVERLRYRKNLAWLSYSDDASGRFVGAWRDQNGSIILNQSSPDRDGGRPFEVVVGADGSRTPIERELKGGYDPRRKGWYRQAIARDGLSWTEPYEFNEGKVGITSALALRDPSTRQVRGVFTADFFLDDLSRFLSDLVGGGQIRAFVLSRNADVIASSAGRSGDPLLTSALGAMPDSLATLQVGRPLSVRFEHDGVRHAGVFQVFRLAGELEWATGVMAPEDSFLGVVYDNAWFAAAVGVLVLALAVGLGSFLAYRLSAALSTIASDVERVGRFDLSREPGPTSSVKEIAVVSRAVERMKASLRSFGHYVPTELVRQVVANGTEAELGGEMRELTIHFSDIVGFTSASEGMEPTALVEHLGEYLQEMTTVLEAESGTIDKFLGDGILAFFNAPNEVDDHTARACRAALKEQDRLRALESKWAAAGKPVLRARIGLHRGEALVGNIGTPDRFEYTVVGDSVNLASRLEGLNKVYGTGILASQAVRDAAGPAFEWRTLDRVAVVGRREGTLVSELLGERGQAAAEVLRARDLYESALEAYFERRFEEAATGFQAAAEAVAGNRAAEVMRLRAEACQREAPPEDWDAIHVEVSK
jgi:adenylate cyclase